jgi:membrane-bound lytic murein transglycosylase D
MRKHLFLLFFLSCTWVQAQSITVPDNLYLADQRMKLSSGGQQEIQKKVDELLRYPKYFQAKVALADTYFPIIERVFREEGLPDDFKYLVLIESGLVSDAVSTSNAVGFWQFKKDTATDYGMQVNQDIDERKHIIASSRSAARYLLKSNNLYYQNWHNTILSYYHGFTGAKSLTKPGHVGQKEMEVTQRTDVYILKLLAHKVAYENAIGRNPAPAVVLQEVPASGKSLSELALEMTVNEGELQRYNKWLAGNYIPNDKTYTVMVPVTNPGQQGLVLASQRNPGPTVAKTPAPVVVTEKVGKREYKKLNGLKVIIARSGDTKDKLALQARMSTKRFLDLNDMHSFDQIVAGQPYYTERKHSKAQVQYHVVKPGERIQQIAQQHGVKMRSILWNNRMKANEVLATGRLLWMQHRRPSRTPVEYQKTYPEAPTRTPANPVILAHDEVLDEINAGTATASSQQPDPSRKPAKDYPGGKLSGTTPPPAEGRAAKAEAVLAPVQTAAVQPLDAALAHTNEAPAKDLILLSEEIDQQVEHINQESPALYRKTPAAETGMAGPNAPAAETHEPLVVKPFPAAGEIPAVVLREPAGSPAITVPVQEGAAARATGTAAGTQEPAAPKATPFAFQTPGIHVVAAGETLYGISRKYAITTGELKSWNGLGDVPLSIGQSLKVAAPPVTAAVPPLAPASQPLADGPAASGAAKAGTATHTVAMGESMYQISRRYGVTIKDIMAWNGKADFNVTPGEKLLIKVAAASRE